MLSFVEICHCADDLLRAFFRSSERSFYIRFLSPMRHIGSLRLDRSLARSSKSPFFIFVFEFSFFYAFVQEIVKDCVDIFYVDYWAFLIFVSSSLDHLSD